MSKYPCLTEMGVEKEAIQDIYKYTLRQEGNDDVLKVYFQRRPGTLLASSRKFRFGRAARTVKVKDSTEGYKEFAEMSPFLMKAIDELHTLVRKEHDKKLCKERLLDDIDHLEKVMHNKLAELRRDIEKLD